MRKNRPKLEKRKSFGVIGFLVFSGELRKPLFFQNEKILSKFENLQFKLGQLNLESIVF